MDDSSKVSPDPGDILSAGLLYTSKGFRVFPCLPLKKEPAIRAWQVHATTDEQVVRGWFTEFPDRNLAIACGPQPNGLNLLVIDIDPRHGGLESWKALIREHGESGMRDTAIHTTPHGGFHIFLNAPDGFRNTRNKLGDGIDTRCEGGYVLVPPSAIRVASGELRAYVPQEALWSV